MVEYKELFDEKVYIIKAEEELLTLSNGYTITSEHCADCCEYNYIDFSAVYDTILRFFSPEKILLRKSMVVSIDTPSLSLSDINKYTLTSLSGLKR